MTPIEKAEELTLKFAPYSEDNVNIDISKMILAKECASIAADEIIKQWMYIDTYLGDGRGELNPNLKYWLEVKQEIEKL